jgi:hypothetical protein
MCPGTRYVHPGGCQDPVGRSRLAPRPGATTRIELRGVEVRPVWSHVVRAFVELDLACIAESPCTAVGRRPKGCAGAPMRPVSFRARNRLLA